MTGHETFSAKFQIQDAARDEFEGHASVFGSMVNAFIPTVIERGAFRQTLRENRNRIKILWQHNDAQPIGKPLELEETADGLRIRGKISQRTTGRDALILLRDKVVDELSIGFDPVKWTMERGGPDGPEIIRHISELRLWEVSLVTFAADPNAKVQAVHRHADLIARVQCQLADLERAYRVAEIDAALRELRR